MFRVRLYRYETTGDGELEEARVDGRGGLGPVSEDYRGLLAKACMSGGDVVLTSSVKLPPLPQL